MHAAAASMEISSGFYTSSADLEILDDQIFFQQYNWTAALNEVMFASHEETLPQLEEPLTKHLTTTHSHSPQYSFFDTSNCTSDASLHRVVAERKRREKMSHRFVALSSLLPHLKKMDKASILREAIRHITQLQRKIETLEKNKVTTNTKRWNSVIRSCSSVPVHAQSLPLIEVRIYNSEVLISIHHERRKGVMERVVGEIEKLHLSLVNCSLVPFGVSQLNITIIAKMEKEIGMRVEEVVDKLHAALQM